MKILIIGAGNMGKAFIESFIQKKFVQTNQITVVERFETQQEAIKQLGIKNIYAEIGPFVSEQDIIILATKPQDAQQVYPILKNYIHENQIFLSIMAGITIQEISEQLGTNKIVRCMPNLPCQLGLGVTGIYIDKSIEPEKSKYIHDLIACTGMAVSLENEAQIHSIIAISGSGPAYVFYMMQAMIGQAIEYNYTESEAKDMVVQTFEGAIQLFKNNPFSCQEWIQKVASKGGTTEAAIRTFNEENLDKSIQKGMEAAHNRSVEMSLKK